MVLSERWRLLVTGEERIDKIIGIAELAYAVRPFNEVVKQAKQIESSIFETSYSKENYTSTMDKLILNMKGLIEDQTRSHLVQLSTRSIQDSMDKRIEQINEEMEMKGKSININNINYKISDEGDDDDVKKVKEILQMEERLFKESWHKYIDGQMDQSHRQRKMHAERLRLSIQNMQLQQIVNQQQQNVSASNYSTARVTSNPTAAPGSKSFTIEPAATPPSSFSSTSSYSSTSTSNTNLSNQEIHSSDPSSKSPDSLSSILLTDASTISNNTDQIIHSTSLLENL